MEDETRRRYIIAGILVGTATVGLIVLARKTPRDQWGKTLLRIARDGVSIIKGRYGNTDTMKIVETALDRIEEAGAGDTTAMSRAFTDAIASKPHPT